MGVLDFLQMCGKIKSTKRQGWVDSGISPVESVSDHMHRMALMTLLLSDSTISKDRCIKIATVHVIFLDISLLFFNLSKF